MRAFTVLWRTIVTFYNEMFTLIGLSLLWWVTGGFFVGLAVFFGWPLLVEGGAWWLAPLLAIPAGPATAALAVVARRCVRDIHVDRSYYFDGFRVYWRQALVVSAICAIGLALLFLNLIFYLNQGAPLLRALSVLWAYLILFWVSVQFYVYPMLVGLERPSVWGAFRSAALIVGANPFYSLMLAVLAGVLTALSVVLVILVVMAWPALMALFSEHGGHLVLVRAGILKDENVTPKGR